MTSVCDTCKRDKCRVRMDGLKMCDIRVTESNWERLFGTPERTARTVLSLDYCCENCDECPAFEICGLHSKFGRTIYEMAEWLESEVRDD